MSAEVLDYHQNPKAEARWANMERVRLIDRMVANEPFERVPICACNPGFGPPHTCKGCVTIDTAPSEYVAPEGDSA